MPAAPPPISISTALVDDWLRLPVMARMPAEAPGLIWPLLVKEVVAVLRVPEPFIYPVGVLWKVPVPGPIRHTIAWGKCQE